MEKQDTVTDTGESRQTVGGLWDTADVAAFLKVGHSTVRYYVKNKGLPVLRVVGRIRYEPDAVREWARSQSEIVAEEKGAA